MKSYLMQSDVCHPNIVFGINSETMRHVQSVIKIIYMHMYIAQYV